MKGKNKNRFVEWVGRVGLYGVLTATLVMAWPTVIQADDCPHCHVPDPDWDPYLDPYGAAECIPMDITLELDPPFLGIKKEKDDKGERLISPPSRGMAKVKFSYTGGTVTYKWKLFWKCLFDPEPTSGSSFVHFIEHGEPSPKYLDENVEVTTRLNLEQNGEIKTYSCTQVSNFTVVAVSVEMPIIVCKCGKVDDVIPLTLTILPDDLPPEQEVTLFSDMDEFIFEDIGKTIPMKSIYFVSDLPLTLYLDNYTGTEDQPGIPLGRHELTLSHEESGAYYTVKLKVIKLEMAMDGDRDDKIKFDDPDDGKYLFWVNDDIDVISGGEEDDSQVGTANSNDKSITCKRDLEDFTRLHIKVDNTIANQSGITYFLKFENITVGAPVVNVFEAVDTSSDYLSDSSVAASQIRKQSLTLNGIGKTEVQVASQYIKSGNQVSPFIIEGRHEGKGNLTLIVKKDGKEICRTSVQLEVHTIDWFYDIFRTSVTSGSTTDVNIRDTAEKVQTAQYTAQSGEYLLFVHGWNMAEWEKGRWAETVFKRLWWQGYQGKVGLFSWPTLSGFEGTLYQLLFDSHHFDNSELRSWLSSDSLEGVFGNLNTAGQLRILAHSMGNVVSGEAIRKYRGILHTYVASQAALSAHCYDNTVSVPVNQAIDVPWWPFDPNAPITTPNLYGYYHSGIQGADPFLYDNQNNVGNLRNYYNLNDWALIRWELNNVLKPDEVAPYLYGYRGRTNQYEEGVDRFFRGHIKTPSEILRVDDEHQRYQIFAYCTESRVKALGQVTLRGGFSTWNLATSRLRYNDEHYSHSREFRSNIADEWDYWSTIMKDCDFTSTIPQQ